MKIRNLICSMTLLFSSSVFAGSESGWVSITELVPSPFHNWIEVRGVGNIDNCSNSKVVIPYTYHNEEQRAHLYSVLLTAVTTQKQVKIYTNCVTEGYNRIDWVVIQ